MLLKKLKKNKKKNEKNFNKIFTNKKYTRSRYIN